MRAIAALLLVAACSRAGHDGNLDRALECAAAQIAADAPANPDLVPTITDTLRTVATRPLNLQALHQLARAMTSAPDLAHIAFALADAGDLAGARTAADHALARATHGSAAMDADRANAPANDAKADADRANAIGFAALTLAWTGDPARAEQVAAGDAMSLFGVAEGAARGGNKAAGEHAYAAALAAKAPEGDLALAFHVEQIAVLTWLGRVPDAQQQLAALTDPVWHMYAASQLARNAVFAHAAEASALLHAAVDESARLAADPTADHSSLFAFRSQLAVELEDLGDHAGAIALRTALAREAMADLSAPDGGASGSGLAQGLEAPTGPSAIDRLALLAVYAEYAHASEEADAIVARLGNQAPPDTRAVLAALRGRFSEALGQLALVGPVLRDEVQLIVWARLAARPEAALSAQLRSVVCGH